MYMAVIRHRPVHPGYLLLLVLNLHMNFLITVPGRFRQQYLDAMICIDQPLERLGACHFAFGLTSGFIARIAML
jgi:hypothetical protein